MDMIRLSVPSTLLFRDLVLRVVASSCRLLRILALPKQEASRAKQEASRDSHSFDDKVVSAVGEAFNNVAIHAYRGMVAGTVELELEVSKDGITIRIFDHGAAFEPSLEQPPDLDSLPESHMGLYIVRSFMDEVSYQPGRSANLPNVLTLTKRYHVDGC